jgi:hypothetical protein
MSNKTKNAPRLKAAVNPSLPESGQGITSSLRSHKTIGRTTTTAPKATPAAKATTAAKNATTKPRAQAPQATKQVPSSRPKLGPGAKVVNNAINGTEIVADFEQSFLVGAEATEKKASSSKDVQRPKRKSGALRPCLYAYLFLPFRIISQKKETWLLQVSFMTIILWLPFIILSQLASYRRRPRRSHKR